jgi:hypothetical protein
VRARRADRGNGMSRTRPEQRVLGDQRAVEIEREGCNATREGRRKLEQR